MSKTIKRHTRRSFIAKMVTDCLDEMYRLSYPSITWTQLNKIAKKEIADGAKPTETKMFERYYLPENVAKKVVDDYVNGYELKSDLPEITEILKDYFKHPMADEYIKDEDGDSYRKAVKKEPMSIAAYEEVEKYLTMANTFFRWDGDERAFTFDVWDLGPTSSRETVEKYWREHGKPDFKCPEDSYWIDPWEETD